MNMSLFGKYSMKILPRMLAILLAALMAVGVVAVDYFVLYSPEVNSIGKGTLASGGNKNDGSDLLNSGGLTINGEEIGDTTIEVSDKIYNFLIMGHDRAARLTDVIMLINYNIELQRIVIMQIPRDTYVEVEKSTYHKINGVYNYYVQKAQKDGSDNPELDGCKGMESFLEKSLAINIHYSAVMDLEGFGNIVDAIGGVDMNVPMDMYYSDPEQNLYINLRKGYQHLDGNAAEQFVRYRAGYATGDIGRTNAQKIFVSAFIDKLLTSITDINTITALANNVVKYVETDITVADVIYFAKSFLGFGASPKSVDLSNVMMMTMPGRDTMYNGGSYYVMNKDYVSYLTTEYFNIYFYEFQPVLWDFDVNGVYVTDEEGAIRNIYYMNKDEIRLDIENAADIEENGLN